MAKETRKEKPAEKIKLEAVIASYPNLTEPDDFGRLTCDILFDKADKKHMAQLDALKKKILKVKTANYGTDKAEWSPDTKKVLVKDGDEREDQPTYNNRYAITVTTNEKFGVDAIDTAGRPFDISKIRGGMLVDVLVRVAPYSYEKKGKVIKEGVSLYLQGFMIDPARPVIQGFGGRPNLASEFGVDSDTVADEEDEGEETPRSSKSKAKNFSDDEEE